MASSRLNHALLDAAKVGDLEKFRNYLAKGADINDGGGFSGTPLLAAAKGGFINIVKLLFKRKDIDLNKQEKYDGTPLHAASSRGCISIVKLLLERTDIDPNKENNYYGDSPLHVAASSGNLDIVQLLLERTDIDLNKEHKLSYDGLSTASFFSQYNGETPLHAAASGENLDIVQLLLERADIDPNKETKYYGTPLHAAANSGFINIVKLLLERADIDPNKQKKRGELGLLTADRCFQIPDSKRIFVSQTAVKVTILDNPRNFIVLSSKDIDIFPVKNFKKYIINAMELRFTFTEGYVFSKRDKESRKIVDEQVTSSCITERHS